ncbi:MAG: hypothetical protein ACK4NS_02175 [Saprospiraceae bacterium]
MREVNAHDSSNLKPVVTGIWLLLLYDYAAASTRSWEFQWLRRSFNNLLSGGLKQQQIGLKKQLDGRIKTQNGNRQIG